MAVQSVPLATIEDFLAQKRIAIVGISREPRSDSVIMFKELCRRGYDVIPVNPYMPEALGRRCFARVQDIQPPVQAAILMTSPEVTDTVVGDRVEAGIRRVWMYRGVGKGAVSDRAIAFCHERGINVIPGECPFMFLPGTGASIVFTDSFARLPASIRVVLTLQTDIRLRRQRLFLLT